jgi:hypothetical protein
MQTGDEVAKTDMEAVLMPLLDEPQCTGEIYYLLALETPVQEFTPGKIFAI